ncbi:MAG TPA: DUF4407 domain-containing protein [Bacteroidia bacterium]|nr:DUF4407 domain-containing protein [Bacteroidia bacterium]
MKKMNFITRFLCSCAGCDIATLQQCNSAEQRKMAIIGSCVLITPMLGVASGTFAMLTFSKNLPLSIGFGLLWGFVIFLIERAVVANTRPGQFNMGVLARLLLACIFAMVIAVPMELKVFEDAIQEKLVNNLNENVKGINADYDAQIEKINKDLNAEKSKADALRLSYIGEVDGTTGSKVTYRGPIAREKERLWNQEAAVYNKMTADAQKQIDALNKQRGQKITATSESQAVGFLGRMRALGELSKEDNTVFWGVWLIRLFFLAIELIPIFVKLSSGNGSNVYHDIAKQNGAMAVSVNAQMEEVRAEEMIKQQRATVNKELLELQFAEEKAVMDDAQKRFDFYMAQLKKVSDRKLQAQQHIFSTVKDENLRHHLMEQIEQIYDDFQFTLMQLVNRKQAGSDFINNLS